MTPFSIDTSFAESSSIFSFEGICLLRREADVGQGMAGVDDGEEPPVPIPNTEVKLIHAEDTKMATSWENRAAPTPFVSAAKLLLSC